MTIKKPIITVFSILLVIGMLAGCSPAATEVPAAAPTEAPTQAATDAATAAPATEAFSVTDTFGREVNFESLPQRIVVAGKSSSLIINSLFMFPEASDRVLSYGTGNQTSMDFLAMIDPKLDEKTAFENTVGAEQIAPLKPDLVILKDVVKESLGTPLETMGIKVIYLNLESPDKFYADIQVLGKIFGNETRANEIVSYYQASVAKVTDKLAEVKEGSQPKALLLQYSAKGGTVAFKVAPTSWLQTQMVQMAGGAPVWLDITNEDGWNVVTLEQIAAWKPEIIFIVDYSGKAVDTVKTLKTDAQWQGLDAVKNGKIFAFPHDFISWDQPDTRWSLGLTWLATKLQPELFADVNMTDEITGFYQTLYGLDTATITEKVLPLYKAD